MRLLTTLRGALSCFTLVTLSIQILLFHHEAFDVEKTGFQLAMPSNSRAGMGIDQRIAAELMAAGVNLTELSTEMIASIPKWEDISKIYGDGSEPRILGMDTCHDFQALVGEGKRYTGVAGMFNSGTNLLAELLDENCDFTQGEAMWQVPWGKHGRASTRDTRTAGGYEKYNKDKVLPVVVVRNPFYFMESMCRNSYTVRYSTDHNSSCPHLVDSITRELLPVHVGQRPPGTKYNSIAHFWNAWYQEYLDFPHPRLIVRLEDLTIRPQETIRSICQCAGGTMEPTFEYVVDSPKRGMGHGEASEQNGLVEAWARIGKALPYSIQDYEAAKEELDGDLLGVFGYEAPLRTLR